MSERISKPDDLDPTGDTVSPSGPTLETPQIRITVSDTMQAVDQVDEPEATTAQRDEPKNRLPTGMHESGMLGRFHILDILGAGGMGVVLSAYDPQLDRKVAIKVLRTRGLTGPRREKEAARLLREARSMAQLSHPHVVTVYEAGTIDDRVFIAMEYVPGQTLRSWLADSKRTVAEILDVYIKAGRGLAAGHQAGLIHRDFKPDNVLVGFDGRVRVIDFGLARPSRTNVDTPVDEVTPSGTFPVGNPTSHLTTAGTLFGTPMYMAPEQHLKMELDARADQFSFCVALFESLYGRVPFPATSYGELSEAVTKGKLEQPEVNPAISTRVAEAVQRGLRPTPDERFQSMDGLLDELEPQARRRRGIAVAAAGIGAILAAAITLVVVRVTTDKDAVAADAPCEGGEARLAGVWDGPTKDRVKTAFLATHRTHAPATFERVAYTLDRYATDWVDRRRDVCEATEVRKEQSEAAFDLRMKCLGERLEVMRVLTGLFAKADAALADQAVIASQTLARPDDCMTLHPGMKIPPSPAQAAQLERLEHELLEIQANQAAGKYAVALDAAESLAARAKKLEYTPFEAKVLFRLGVTQSGASKPAEAEKTLRETLDVAARAKDDGIIAQAWTYLIYVVGHQLGRYEDGLALQMPAETSIRRVEGELKLRNELTYNLATMHFTKGKYALANAAFESALKLQLEATGESHMVAQIHSSLGGSYLRSNNVFAAKKSFEKALAMMTKQLGPAHPETALPLANLGSLAQALGNWDEATRYQERALKILEELHGPDHDQVGQVVYSLALSANGREDYKGALPYYERALAIFEKIGPNHPFVGLSLIGIADCREEIGDAAGAVPPGERALALMQTTKDPDPVQLAMARFILAKALWAANREKPRARALALEARKGFAAGGLAALNGTVAVNEWFEKIDGKK